MTEEDIIEASEWGFNCGPAALCAVLDRSPHGIREYLLDFEAKRYTNPAMMLKILKGLGVSYKQVYRGDSPYSRHVCQSIKTPRSLMRIQWSGSWTLPGIPMTSRQRHTHWVATRSNATEVFDINAMKVNNGWVSFDVWENSVVPWVGKHCVKGWSGSWWPTHIIEIK